MDRSPELELILSDINLGGASGLDFLARLRADGNNTQVILMTGGGKRGDAISAVRLGACDFIEKPLEYGRLRLAIGRAAEFAENRRLAVASKRQLEAQNEQLASRNELIRSLLGRYVDDGIVRELLEKPESLRLGGTRTDATILVTDLRGFTQLSERLEAEHVVELLNNYFELMIQMVREHGGTVDNLIGDALMALFGVPETQPDDAVRAARCALEMQQRVAEVNAANRDAGLPEVQMGIGLNTGEVVAGNIGSERHAKFSVIGSPVNRAWRIESFTVGGQILASKGMVERAGAAIRTTGLLRVKLRGVDEPVEICEILGMA